eukprot:SAG11_NODE_9_length_28972_cov_81.532539_1_plen_182_part_00
MTSCSRNGFQQAAGTQLAEYRASTGRDLVPSRGTVEVLSRYCSDPVLRFAVAIATAIFPTHDLALIGSYYLGTSSLVWLVRRTRVIDIFCPCPAGRVQIYRCPNKLQETMETESPVADGYRYVLYYLLLYRLKHYIILLLYYPLIMFYYIVPIVLFYCIVEHRTRYIIIHIPRYYSIYTRY